MKYICTYCNIYAYDENKGDSATNLETGTKWDQIPETWQCPVCGMPKTYLQQVGDEAFSLIMENYAENPEKNWDLNYYRTKARKMLTTFCGVYPVCNGQPGRLCIGQKYGATIGMGGAGQGNTFGTNYNTLQQYRLKMRVIKPHHEPEMSISIFGKRLTAPVMGAPLSGVKTSLNNAIPEDKFYQGLLTGVKAFGSIGMVGNTSTSPDELGVKSVGENNGWGIPIFKPQSQERLTQLFKLAEGHDAIAMGVDLEGAGSTFWKDPDKRVYRKSEKDLQELVDCTEKPVIFKGIMNPEDAVKVVDSGACACYVSNHGGRVLDCGQGVSEVLPHISTEVSGKIPIMADGAVRTGFDVLKVMALGADIALIGRPLAQVSIGGGGTAVKMYLDYVKDDIRRAMILTGCDNLKEATMDILTKSS